ncbi:hypothetical protein L9F63_023042, partial [Diploptera punctata]
KNVKKVEEATLLVRIKHKEASPKALRRQPLQRTTLQYISSHKVMVQELLPCTLSGIRIDAILTQQLHYYYYIIYYITSKPCVSHVKKGNLPVGLTYAGFSEGPALGQNYYGLDTVMRRLTGITYRSVNTSPHTITSHFSTSVSVCHLF